MSGCYDETPPPVGSRGNDLLEAGGKWRRTSAPLRTLPRRQGVRRELARHCARHCGRSV